MVQDLIRVPFGRHALNYAEIKKKVILRKKAGKNIWIQPACPRCKGQTPPCGLLLSIPAGSTWLPTFLSNGIGILDIL